MQLAYVIANTSGIGNILDEFNFDISGTWICQQPTSSLHDETTREKFIQSIYSMLEKKRSSIETAGESKEAPQQEEEQAAPEHTETPAAATTSMLGSLVQRCKALFR